MLSRFAREMELAGLSVEELTAQYARSQSGKPQARGSRTARIPVGQMIREILAREYPGSEPPECFLPSLTDSPSHPAA